MEILPFSATLSNVLLSALVSSRFTLSKDEVDRLRDVRRGELGCLVSSTCGVSPFVFGSSGGSG
jgi:hypothetical protein